MTKIILFYFRNQKLKSIIFCYLLLSQHQSYLNFLWFLMVLILILISLKINNFCHRFPTPVDTGRIIRTSIIVSINRWEVIIHNNFCTSTSRVIITTYYVHITSNHRAGKSNFSRLYIYYDQSQMSKLSTNLKFQIGRLSLPKKRVNNRTICYQENFS